MTKEEFESIYQKHLKDDFKSELQKASRIGQVAGATGDFVLGQDPTAALGTAKTATENNFEINMPPEVAEAAVGQIEAAWEEYKSNPKFRGKVNVALGFASLATGGTSGLIAAAGESVVGGIAVATGAAIAVDQITTGAKMMYTGTDQPSTFDQGLASTGMPEWARIATLGVVGMFEPGSFLEKGLESGLRQVARIL